IRQLKQTANKPVTRLVLLTGFNTPPAPSPEGSQLQPVTKQIAQIFLNWHIGILPHWHIIFLYWNQTINSKQFLVFCLPLL
ncbi:hypothetical protein, partial [uncultured Parabacteroides sp.]|uniref:hypothetical protein n=1 Tax=uncultured Parabacteroides sp. TaxID=512312 RepID=UPI00259437A9